MWQNKLYILLQKIVIFLMGIFLILSSIFTFLALCSFHPEDPSFNSSSTIGHVENWMGIVGSHISDLLFQIIGITAFLLCFVLFRIGIKISSRGSKKDIVIKFILLPIFTLSLSSFFAIFPEPDWWIFSSLGGVNGFFILNKLFLPQIITTFIALLIAIVTFLKIIEVTISDIIYSYRFSILVFKFLINTLLDKILKYGISNTVATDIPDRVKLQNDDINPNDDIEESKKIKVKKVNDERVTIKKINKTRLSVQNLSKDGTLYKLPRTDILNEIEQDNIKKAGKKQLEEQGKLLVKTLGDFGVHGEAISAKLGPVITLHEFEPAPGTKSSRIIGLAEDIARSMSAVSTRISVMSGKTTIGFELPNKDREIIFFREMVESNEYRYSQASLPLILGKDIGGLPIIADLAKMPHLLVAGTTGSGKSVGVNAMILSLLFRFSPDECKFIMIDPKMLELSIYDGIPHLLAPVVTNPHKAIIALKWAVKEMEERYKLMSSLNVRNINNYNEKITYAKKHNQTLTRTIQTGFDPETGEAIMDEVIIENNKLPYIVVIVDEMADLMLVAGKEIEGSIQRLAQMARAAGIHIIMATQRPSVDVITGIIKANFPTRISFQVTSKIDSRTILGTQGGEQLLGQGDMIYLSGGNKMLRVHGPFCSDGEVEDVVNYIKTQKVEDNNKYNPDKILSEFESVENEEPIKSGKSSASGLSIAIDDKADIYDQAVAIVRRDKKPSISYVQRQLRIGYNKAANLIERMEKEG
ncbi:DNA translocase FtsK 4TM domain-containing protein, partial [Rickettsiales bacterium]|nr:DNA translocase FtsK 4TM domain-containing protein [Rickettsiales bacterium]